jgi:hypothetical protein
MKLILYGLQRSGTNYLEAQLKKNFKVTFLNNKKDRNSPLHKHFRLYDNKDAIPEPRYNNSFFFQDFISFECQLPISPDYYLIISKDPYSWLRSYEKWAKLCNWQSPTHHYIVEYNLFYRKWIEFSYQTNKIDFIRYIDLLADPVNVLDQLRISKELKRKTLTLFLPKNPLRVPQSRKFTPQNFRYYKNEEYLYTYSDEELQKIDDLVDFQVFSFLGYEMKSKI